VSRVPLGYVLSLYHKLYFETGWPQTLHLPASASQLLGLQACARAPSYNLKNDEETNNNNNKNMNPKDLLFVCVLSQFLLF
jgi:hypothetical protein